ncbi:hypothetical protein pb186bvf_017276 [Paramecium bursaria]
MTSSNLFPRTQGGCRNLFNNKMFEVYKSSFYLTHNQKIQDYLLELYSNLYIIQGIQLIRFYKNSKQDIMIKKLVEQYLVEKSHSIGAKVQIFQESNPTIIRWHKMMQFIHNNSTVNETILIFSNLCAEYGDCKHSFI